MCGNGHWPDRLQQKQVTEVWPERFRAQHNQPTL
jgi:lambda repressor-like predicted transcriptional regulator